MLYGRGEAPESTHELGLVHVSMLPLKEKGAHTKVDTRHQYGNSDDQMKCQKQEGGSKNHQEMVEMRFMSNDTLSLVNVRISGKANTIPEGVARAATKPRKQHLKATTRKLRATT